MAKILVAYYSRSGNTQRMAEQVAAAAGGVKGAKVECKPIDKVAPKDLLDYDAIVLGSPTYYGGMAAELKKLLDESVTFHGKLAGKVGGAFSSAANIGGGNETTILGIIQAMLIHAMIVQGSYSGDHYGPVAIGDPDDRAKKECRRLGQSVAALAVKLHG